MALGYLIPYRQYIITTALSPQEVYKGLCIEVVPSTIVTRMAFMPEKPFIGWIKADKFRFTWVWSNKEKYLLWGQIAPQGEGTTINVIIAPGIVALVMMGALAGWAIYGIIRFWPYSLGACLLLLFPLLAIHIGAMTLYDKRMSEIMKVMKEATDADSVEEL